MSTNPFTKIQVHLNYKTGHTIQWWLDPSFIGKTPYSFSLLAFHDAGLKEPIFEKNVGDTFFAIDDLNLRQNSMENYVYQVKLITDDKKEYLSRFVSWTMGDGGDRHKYLIANEITRKSWVGLQYFGLYGYLIKRKLYAPVSATEVDPITGDPIVDSSAGSFGTGMIGGYYTPLLFKYYLQDRKESIDYQPDGRGANYRDDITIKTVAFPYIDSKDILVNIEGKRYCLENANDTFFPGTMISLLQITQAAIIPTTDTIYDIATPDFPTG